MPRVRRRLATVIPDACVTFRVLPRVRIKDSRGTTRSLVYDRESMRHIRRRWKEKSPLTPAESTEIECATYSMFTGILFFVIPCTFISLFLAKFWGPLASLPDLAARAIGYVICLAAFWPLVFAGIWLTRVSLRYRLVSAYLASKLCPACGFDIAGLALDERGDTVCPECGAAWRLDQQQYWSETSTEPRSPAPTAVDHHTS